MLSGGVGYIAPMTAQRLCYLLALLLGSLTLSFAIQPGSEEASMQTSQAPQVSQASPLDSIAFIGASVSAGFGNFAELEVRNNVKLGGFVKHMLVPGKADAKIHDFGSSQFFTDPTPLRRRPNRQGHQGAADHGGRRGFFVLVCLRL